MNVLTLLLACTQPPATTDHPDTALEATAQPCVTDGVLYDQDGIVQRVEIDESGLGWLVIEPRGGQPYRTPYIPDDDGSEICEAQDWIQAREGPGTENVVLDESAGAWWRYYIVAGVYNTIWYHFHGGIEDPDVAELAEAIVIYNEYLGVWEDPDRLLGNQLLMAISDDLDAQTRVASKTDIPVRAISDDWLTEDPNIDSNDWQPANSADRLQDGAWRMSFRLSRIDQLEETGWDVWGDDELYADGLTVLRDSHGRLYDSYEIAYRNPDFMSPQTIPQLNKTWPYDGTQENWAHLLPIEAEDPYFRHSGHLTWYEKDFGDREDIDELLEKIRRLIEKLADKAIDAAVGGLLPDLLDELGEVAEEVGLDPEKVEEAKEKAEEKARENAEKHKDDVIDDLLDFLGELLADDPFSPDLRLTHKLRVEPDYVKFTAWAGTVSSQDEQLQLHVATRETPATVSHNGPHQLSYDDTVYYEVSTDVTVEWMDEPQDPPGVAGDPDVELEPED